MMYPDRAVHPDGTIRYRRTAGGVQVVSRDGTAPRDGVWHNAADLTTWAIRNRLVTGWNRIVPVDDPA